MLLFGASPRWRWPWTGDAADRAARADDRGQPLFEPEDLGGGEINGQTGRQRNDRGLKKSATGPGDTTRLRGKVAPSSTMPVLM